MSLITNYKLKNLKLKNRMVLPPMCMYSAKNGYVNEFHKVHYGSFALGQVGLIILEATGITENGRITDDDLGIWDDRYITGLRELVEFSHSYGSEIGIQLAHAGRKSRTTNLVHHGPSSITFDESYELPKEMDENDIENTIKAFGDGARRSLEAGFDMVEIHGAHGYLVHQFLSPITNRRKDKYGGSLKNRTRFLKEILKEVRRNWPDDKVISLRVSASDYKEDGIDVNMMVEIIEEVKDYIDIVHVSSGGLVDADIKVYPGYQVKFSEIIRRKCNIPTIAVGLLENYDLANYLVEDEKCDLVAIGRGLLRNPNLFMNYIYENNLDYDYLKQYERGF